MKKFNKLALILLTLLLAITLSCCGDNPVYKVSEPEKEVPSMFVQIEYTGVWKVVYHRETKVMYTISSGGYNCGNFTLLVNPDGTPMVYNP